MRKINQRYELEMFIECFGFIILGGETAVNAAVDLFYKKVLADTLLQPFFEHIDMNVQIKKQKQFLTYAFGGLNHYSGRGLRNAYHAAVEKGMNDTYFDRVMLHLGTTLNELGVDQALITEAAAITECTRKDVLNQVIASRY